MIFTKRIPSTSTEYLWNNVKGNALRGALPFSFGRLCGTAVRMIAKNYPGVQYASKKRAHCALSVIR